MPDLRRAILVILFVAVAAVQVRWATSTVSVLVQPVNAANLIDAVNGSLELGEPGAKLIGAAAQATDRVVAFGGEAVSDRHTLYRRLMVAPVGPVTLTLARGAERVLVPFTVTRNEERSGFWSVLLVISLNILIPGLCVLLGFFVAWCRPAELRAWLLLLTLLGWSQFVHSNSWMRWGWSYEMRALGFALESFVSLFWPSAWLWFCVDFPDARQRALTFRVVRVIFIVPAFVLALLNAVSGGLRAFSPAPLPWGPVFSWLNEYSVFSILLMGPIGFSFATLFHRFFRERNPDQRRRLRLFLTGLNLGLLPIALMVLYTFLAQKILDDIPEPILIPGLLMFGFLPLTLAYVVLVERAFDVGVVLRQGLQYAVATRGVKAIRMAIIAALLFYAFRIGSDASLNTPQRLTRFSVAIGAAFLLSRAFVPVLAWVDRRFFREAVDTERLLNKLHTDVVRLVDTRQVLETVAVRVSEALHVSCVAGLAPVNGHFVAAHSIGCAADAALPAAGAVVARLNQGAQNVAQLRRVADADEFVALEALNAEVLLPLMAQERLLGILSLGPKQSEEPYSPTDLRLLESVAVQTGLALENSRLTAAVAQEAAQRERIHREIEIAREVQERLLPREGPRVPGLDYAGHCRPALTIGGDYFDYLQTPSGEVGFALGDIAGKGVPAALLMASLQASLRGLTAGGVSDLRELMAKLNTLVYDATPKNRFATFVYVLYDQATRHARLCSAGHNASLLIRQGQVEWIRPAGVALGLTRRAKYEQAELTLEADDRLILYTDGITEARDASGEEYGEARLAELALGMGELGAAESLAAIVADVDRFVGGAPQHDDLTAVVLRAG